MNFSTLDWEIHSFAEFVFTLSVLRIFHTAEVMQDLHLLEGCSTSIIFAWKTNFALGWGGIMKQKTVSRRLLRIYKCISVFFARVLEKYMQCNLLTGFL